MRFLACATLLVATTLTACGGGRSASEPAGSDDLNVSQVGPATVAAGTTATFTALVVNTGRNEATNLVITETLTAGYTATVTCVPSFGALCPATLGPSMLARQAALPMPVVSRRVDDPEDNDRIRPYDEKHAVGKSPGQRTA